MAKSKTKLVKRIVTGPKPIHGYDKDGNRKVYKVGDEILLSPIAAKRFARYLASPEVAKAEQEVKKAEAKASAEGTDAADKTEADKIEDAA